MGVANSTTAVAATADGVNPQLIGMVEPGYFNGGAAAISVDRAYAASAVNLGTTQSKGAALATSPGNWSITSAPAVNTVATVTKAGVGGTRHVCTSIHASLYVTGVTTAGGLLVTLRDGASGIGSILWSGYMVVQNIIGFVDRIIVLPLNTVGTAGNAMTLEFASSAGLATFEAISLTGYDAV